MPRRPQGQAEADDATLIVPIGAGLGAEEGLDLPNGQPNSLGYVLGPDGPALGEQGDHVGEKLHAVEGNDEASLGSFWPGGQPLDLLSFVVESL
ncbi:MAG: hypothetical protein M3450_11480 [Actinomycetota bacterium]|nr:hypothetical protein [Actinomycetota bacterium]MDQ3642052.1 hypothetical protein [Actinomycetota bacterium]